jgi:hypothetical protein
MVDHYVYFCITSVGLIVVMLLSINFCLCMLLPTAISMKSLILSYTVFCLHLINGSLYYISYATSKNKFVPLFDVYVHGSCLYISHDMFGVGGGIQQTLLQPNQTKKEIPF